MCTLGYCDFNNLMGLIRKKLPSSYNCLLKKEFQKNEPFLENLHSKNKKIL